MTGLTIAVNNNAKMRFLTLTSANTQKRSIKKSFDVLRKRIRRAKIYDKKGYKKDGFQGFNFNRYFCLRTSEGNGVLHIIYWGQYIPIQWLKKNWFDIHGAYQVNIQLLKQKYGVKRIVNYLITNYLQAQPVERMSYGWKWAWLGFCKSWEKVKETYRDLRFSQSTPRKKDWLKTYFSSTRRNRYIEAWKSILKDPPCTSRQKKLTSFSFFVTFF